MLRIALLVTALMLSATASAESFSSLEERMSAAEFRAAGLDKLNEAELKALNDWVRGERSLAPAGQPYVEDRRGLSDPSYGSGDEIVSRISGEFRGWKGTQSVFTLENGQVWQSVDPSATFAVKLTSPSVSVTPGAFGAWFLRVEGYSSSVRVKRIK